MQQDTNNTVFQRFHILGLTFTLLIFIILRININFDRLNNLQFKACVLVKGKINYKVHFLYYITISLHEFQS